MTALADSPSTALPAERFVAHQAVVKQPPRRKLWLPAEAIFTASALVQPWGQQIHTRLESLGIPIRRLAFDRLPSLRGKTDRETYARAKRTLAVVNAPPSHLRLQPIPPSADFQFHIAQGCPAHCQYCYLAGSLSGPPVTRVYANLPEILANLEGYRVSDATARPTTFEVSCYTDPLGIEHLTGGLAECIRWFGQHGGDRHGDMRLRWVSKFDAVEPLMGLPHRGRTRCRFSINAATATGAMEGGTASFDSRLAAARKLSERGYPVGLVVAPIMPVPGWWEAYADLFARASAALGASRDLTVELITHRFTAGSKATLLSWYPATRLDLDESKRQIKRNKFGGSKFVYRREEMTEMRDWFGAEIARQLPAARVVYWT